MAGFSSLEDLRQDASYTNGREFRLPFLKVGGTMAAGFNLNWYSFWTQAGNPVAGSAGANRPAGTSISQDATGLIFPNRAAEYKYLTRFGAVATQDMTLMLYDRLYSAGSISGATGAQTVTGATVPRYTTGDGVQAWFEVTTATTVSTGVWRINSYTNQAGTAAKVSDLFSMNATVYSAGAMLGPMPLAAGDTGIRSVQSISNTVSSGGTIRLVLLKPLAFISLIANQYNEYDFFTQRCAPERVYDGATLGIAGFARTTTATTIAGCVWAVSG